MRKAFSPAMIARAERWGLWLVGGTVVVSLLVAVLAGKDALVQNVARIPWGMVAVLLGLNMGCNFLRFYRYVVAGRKLGLGVPFWDFMYYHAVGYALVPTPGKLGVAIRMWLLKKYRNLPYSRTTPLIVMDLITDALGMAALAAVALVWLDDARLKTLGVAILAGLLAGVLVVVLAPRYMEGVVKLGYRLLGRKKPRAFARLLVLVRTTSHVFGPKMLLATMGLSFLAWVLIGVGTAWLVQGFGNPAFTLAQGCMVTAVSLLGGVLTMMPAGVGGTEVSMTGFMAMFGVPLGQAVLITLLVRLITVWFTVILGMLLLPGAMKGARGLGG